MKIISGNWRSSLAIHCWSRTQKFSMTFLIISMRNSINFHSNFSLKSWRDWRWCLRALSFKFPKENSHTGLVRSGDRVGHSTSLLKEIRQPWSIFLNTERTSCVNPTLLSDLSRHDYFLWRYIKNRFFFSTSKD